MIAGAPPKQAAPDALAEPSAAVPPEPAGADGQGATEERVALVLRLLRGEPVMELVRETGRPRKQLVAWKRRFLEGGEAALGGRPDAETEELRAARQELADRVAALEADNRALTRRLALLTRSRSSRAPHPFCSAEYALALEEPGVRPLRVEEWGTYALVRETATGLRQATGLRPIASLDPDCDVRGGLETLRRNGIASVSLVTDPMWSPDVTVLRDAFTSCRPFKESFLIDREAERVHLRKRHRNMVNRARRAVEVREVPLGDHLGRWAELYGRNVENRKIAQPFGAAYFERLLDVPGLRTLAVVLDGEIVTITIWVHYEDVLYYHDGASSEEGFEASASYAAFAHVIDNATDFRYLVLGGSAHFRDEPQDGLAVFKRGFANASETSYLCSATLTRPARPGS